MPKEYPNWPWELPKASIVSTQPIVITEQSDQVPLHATIQEAKAAGVETGDLVSAPLAPAKGAVTGLPESMVVVTIKKLMDTPTGKAIKALLITAVVIVLGTLSISFARVWTGGHSIWDKGAMDWHATFVASEIASAPIVMAGLIAILKKYDNNVVN